MICRYNIQKITQAACEVLLLNGVFKEQAEALCNHLMKADICGVHTHGMSIFPAYINRIQAGGFNLKEVPEVVKSTSAFSVVNANNTLGAASASFCMAKCIDECSKSGIYTVFSHNANTFGAAFLYAFQATESRKIGICCSNSPSAMPAWNGTKKLLGTNPFAFGIPADKYSPIILDMATSVVAKSKINEARKAGKDIPLNWALDKDGNATTDPVKAIEGMMLPMAEHKGYGIALVIDILAGVLSGAGYLDHINRFYSKTNEGMNVGQLFIAIDPEIISSSVFYRNIDAYIDEIHASGSNVKYPGENKHHEAQVCMQNGVFLADETVKELRALFEQYGIKDVFT